MRPTPCLLASISAACLVLATLAPTPASAQIVNTLRGFGPDEPGWSGQVQAGFSRSGGNTDLLSLAAGGRLQHQGDRQRWRLLGDVSREESSGERTDESTLGHLRHNFELWPRIHTLAFTQASRQPFQRLESRFLFGAGARFDILRHEDLRGSLGLAHMVEIEKVDESPSSDTDQRLSSFLSLMGRVSGNTTADVIVFAQPRWSDFGDLRATVQASLTIEIVDRLALVIAANVMHDTEPPDRVEDTDWRTRTSVAWKL